MPIRTTYLLYRVERDTREYADSWKMLSVCDVRIRSDADGDDNRPMVSGRPPEDSTTVIHIYKWAVGGFARGAEDP